MAIKTGQQSPRQDDLALPRILCLHGGGSNARIFRAQTRALRSELAGQFRFVFADAPFASEAGPDVGSAYAHFGPFRRWLRSGPQHPAVDAAEAVACIDAALRGAMDRDGAAGGCGPWAAVLGFSQGAKMAASLLFRQQVRGVTSAAATTAFRFAVVMNGRGPLVALDSHLLATSALADASQVALESPPTPDDLRRREHILRLPTIHVHGLADPGLMLHRKLLQAYCLREAARLVEWEGAHRVPVKTKDVAPLVREILRTARETGALGLDNEIHRPEVRQNRI